MLELGQPLTVPRGVGYVVLHAHSNRRMGSILFRCWRFTTAMEDQPQVENSLRNEG